MSRRRVISNTRSCRRVREGTLSAPVPEAHEGVGVAAQWLFCPMLDDRTALDRTRDAEAHLIWTNRSNLVGWRSLSGPGLRDRRRAALRSRRPPRGPIRAAARVAVHLGRRVFHDEDVAYAQRLRAAGVDTTLEVIAGAPHGVEAWAADSDIARGLLGRARRWLGGTLG